MPDPVVAPPPAGARRGTREPGGDWGTWGTRDVAREYDRRDMSDRAYAVARAVTPRIHAHFAEHVASARDRGREHVASAPDPHAIEAMIDVAFWASLRREESYIPKISLAYLAPDQTDHPLMLEHSLSLDAAVLTRVAPAVERPGIHLGVAHIDGELRVWGTARTIPTYCFVVEVVEPGLIVVKHHRGDERVKFVNVAVLEGDRIKIVDERASAMPDCPNLLTSLLGFDVPDGWVAPVNVLVRLAVAMRAHRRGGLLIVVPAASSAWRDSIIQPISYAIDPIFAELTALRREAPDAGHLNGWLERVDRSVEAIAGLTAVDGATLLTSEYEVLAFGAKITRRRGQPTVERLTVTEPVAGDTPHVVHPSSLGGTRHLSAAQFVFDQRDAVALVASQDGRFTVFGWSGCEDMVHAHRVETLLL